MSFRQFLLGNVTNSNYLTWDSSYALIFLPSFLQTSFPRTSPREGFLGDKDSQSRISDLDLAGMLGQRLMVCFNEDNHERVPCKHKWFDTSQGVPFSRATRSVTNHVETNRFSGTAFLPDFWSVWSLVVCWSWDRWFRCGLTCLLSVPGAFCTLHSTCHKAAQGCAHSVLSLTSQKPFQNRKSCGLLSTLMHGFEVNQNGARG